MCTKNKKKRWIWSPHQRPARSSIRVLLGAKTRMSTPTINHSSLKDNQLLYATTIMSIKVACCSVASSRIFHCRRSSELIVCQRMEEEAMSSANWRRWRCLNPRSIASVSLSRPRCSFRSGSDMIWWILFTRDESLWFHLARYFGGTFIVSAQLSEKIH